MTNTLCYSLRNAGKQNIPCGVIVRNVLINFTFVANKDVVTLTDKNYYKIWYVQVIINFVLEIDQDFNLNSSGMDQ